MKWFYFVVIKLIWFRLLFVNQNKMEVLVALMPFKTVKNVMIINHQVNEYIDLWMYEYPDINDIDSLYHIIEGGCVELIKKLLKKKNMR